MKYSRMVIALGGFLVFSMATPAQAGQAVGGGRSKATNPLAWIVLQQVAQSRGWAFNPQCLEQGPCREALEITQSWYSQLAIQAEGHGSSPAAEAINALQSGQSLSGLLGFGALLIVGLSVVQVVSNWGTGAGDIVCTTETLEDAYRLVGDSGKCVFYACDPDFMFDVYTPSCLKLTLCMSDQQIREGWTRDRAVTHSVNDESSAIRVLRALPCHCPIEPKDIPSVECSID